MRAKLGLSDGGEPASALVEEFLELLLAQQVDFTSAFRALSSVARGDAGRARSLFPDPSGFDAWSQRWLGRLSAEGTDLHAAAAAMDGVNPVYIPRNHRVEEALAAATAGDLQPFERLLEVITRPFTERPGAEDDAVPASPSGAPYRTFCGT